MRRLLLLVCAVCCCLPGWAVAEEKPLDLRQAVIATGRMPDPVTETAARVLVEEVKKRTGRTLLVVSRARRNEDAIVLDAKRVKAPAAFDNTAAGLAKMRAAETFSVTTSLTRAGYSRVNIEAGSPAALIFGIGAFLQKADWAEQQFSVAAGLSVKIAPAYPMRGHQLGYRARANSYDAWDDAQYEQHIRELALFGTNAIENIPFEDNQPSPHMKLSRRDMNRRMSEICAAYGLQYWVWTPATFDLTDAEARAKHLAEHAQLYDDCARLDGVFFPGGDPGDNPPDLVMPFLEELSAVLQQYHPNARIWMSPQGFDEAQQEYVYTWVAQHKPAWLGGLVAGPSSPALSAMRAKLDPAYALRDYPDITHATRAQYPVAWWDPAFALTLGRECINPRPQFYADVIRQLGPSTSGSISYSDGVHDDVNKVVWSHLGMQPDAELQAVLTGYARFFIGPEHASEIAAGILALEKNWDGALTFNSSIEDTANLWRALAEKEPRLESEWRGQMLLVRAQYDEYVQRRQQAERGQETAWIRSVRETPVRKMTDAGLASLREAIARPIEFPGQAAMRTAIEARFDTLYKQIALQTSVPKYQASAPERGCSLDFIDYPLNNRWWLEDQINALIQEVPARHADTRRQRLLAIAQWENPGKGGYYDAVGDPGKSQRVVRDTDMANYPDLERCVVPTQWWWESGMSRARLTWQTSMDWPTALQYNGLNPRATYLLRCTGYGEALPAADGEALQPTKYGKEIGEIKEFPIPASVTADGSLRITWGKPAGEEGLNWREMSRVSEVWLVEQSGK